MNVREVVINRFLGVPQVLHAGFDEGAPADQATVTIVLIHGLGRSSKMWQKIADKVCAIDPNVRVIAVDLLGFGDSPKPTWQTYNAKNQAKNLHATLRKLGVRGPLIIVGHSLGALVAAEFVTMYPKHIKRAFLLSAPIYRDVPDKLFERIPRRVFGENFYKGVMRNLRARQDMAQKLNRYGRRLKIFAPDFVVDEKNLLGTMRSVEMAIENQATYDHIKTITVPTTLMYGRLDPFLIKKYYRALSRANPNVSVASVVAGHEIANSRLFSNRLVVKLVAEIQKN